MCRLCAWAGVALACWRVFVCAYSFRACWGCWICCRIGFFRRLFPARIGAPLVRPGGSGAGWIIGRACCRCWLPGVAGHVCGYVRIVREGMPGGIMAGLWGCCLLWIVFRSAWESAEILQKNSPEKSPRKNFSKIFPLRGNGLQTKNFCKKGVDNDTEP